VTPPREVRSIASRERVPTSEFPNFRDHGRTVERTLLRIIGNLQKRQGTSWASEGGLRRMVCQDSRHMPGISTIAKALVRLAAEGLLVQVHQRGGHGEVLPDGEPCNFGTRLVWIPRTQRQRHAAKRFNKAQPQGRVYSTRRSARDVRMLVAKIAAAERPSMPAPAPARDLRARGREQIERARREHPELWDDVVKPPDKPPD
jgi:hypothetical protein